MGRRKPKTFSPSQQRPPSQSPPPAGLRSLSPSDQDELSVEPQIDDVFPNLQPGEEEILLGEDVQMDQDAPVHQHQVIDESASVGRSSGSDTTATLKIVDEQMDTEVQNKVSDETVMPSQAARSDELNVECAQSSVAPESIYESSGSEYQSANDEYDPNDPSFQLVQRREPRLVENAAQHPPQYRSQLLGSGNARWHFKGWDANQCRFCCRYGHLIKACRRRLNGGLKVSKGKGCFLYNQEMSRVLWALESDQRRGTPILWDEYPHVVSDMLEARRNDPSLRVRPRRNGNSEASGASAAGAAPVRPSGYLAAGAAPVRPSGPSAGVAAPFRSAQPVQVPALVPAQPPQAVQPPTAGPQEFPPLVENQGQLLIGPNEPSMPAASSSVQNAPANINTFPSQSPQTSHMANASYAAAMACSANANSCKTVDGRPRLPDFSGPRAATAYTSTLDPTSVDVIQDVLESAVMFKPLTVGSHHIWINYNPLDSEVILALRLGRVRYRMRLTKPDGTSLERDFNTSYSRCLVPFSQLTPNLEYEVSFRIECEDLNMASSWMKRKFTTMP